VVLADRYYVRRLIGEGAMGRVYEGHHTGVGKRVAIKVPRTASAARASWSSASAGGPGRLADRHPNIADVTDCGSTPDGASSS
jgi:serine/threonine protein kinase